MRTHDWLQIVLLLALSSPGFAEDTDVLRGLRGVAVAVSDLRKEVEQDGLLKVQLQTDVELRIRKAGIRVLTADEWSIEPGQPTVSVGVQLFKNSDRVDAYAKSVLVELRQNVLLSRKPSITLRAATWESSGYVGLSNSRDLQKDIRDNVADQTDEFINAFLAANPR